MWAVSREFIADGLNGFVVTNNKPKSVARIRKKSRVEGSNDGSGQYLQRMKQKNFLTSHELVC
jgi:hypothetical protein